jgi:hypothetical protein
MADVACTRLTDMDTALSERTEPLCSLQGTLQPTELPAGADVDWPTLRPLQCCDLVHKGCKDERTKISVKEGFKKWFTKCGEGYSSCDCAFQVVEHHESQDGMWVPAGIFSLWWNKRHHDHTCVSFWRVFLCPFVMYAVCSVSTKKVHPALKRLVHDHSEILAPMYAESAVRDLFCVPPLSRL